MDGEVLAVDSPGNYCSGTVIESIVLISFGELLKEHGVVSHEIFGVHTVTS